MRKPFELVQDQDARVEYLEILYRHDRRDHPDHPDHDTYSGLFQERVQALLDADFELLTGRPRR